MEESLSLHERYGFLWLIFNPDKIAKLSSERRVLERESAESSSIIVVLLAYCESLHSTLAILTHCLHNIF